MDLLSFDAQNEQLFALLDHTNIILQLIEDLISEAFRLNTLASPMIIIAYLHSMKE